MLNDREAPLRFLRTAYEPTDWVAVFLKTYRTGATAQRVVSLSEATSPRFQNWLRQRNANSWNVYVSVNAVRPGRSRSRDAVSGIRHVFLEEDADGPGLLALLTTTDAPSAAKCSAIAAPIPLDAPVTTATFPFKRFM